MATVRIYKVAELLGTTSQEVVALLKRDHGIEVKGASSTIEEVVGKQFVERMARQRGVSLPSGDMFAEAPVHKPKKPGAAKKLEPPKAAVPALPPPRLVKTHRPTPVDASEGEPQLAEPDATTGTAEMPVEVEPQAEAFPEPIVAAPTAEVTPPEPKTLPAVIEPEPPEPVVEVAPV